MGVVALVAFASTFSVLELAALGAHAWVDGLRHLLAVVASFAFGLSVGLLRTTWFARLATALLVSFVVVVEVAVARHYHAFVDEHLFATARYAWADVRPEVARLLPSLAVATALGTAVLALLPKAPSVPPKWRAFSAAAFVVGIVFGPPLSRSTPELRLVSAFASSSTPRSTARASGGGEASVEVAPLVSTRAVLPNVLVILSESVRHDAYCSPSNACITGAKTRQRTGARVDFEFARSVSSYTAVSLAALITGVPPVVQDRAPGRVANLFDFAKAVRRSDSPPVKVAYWSSQLASVFESDDARRAVDSFVTLETLVGHAVADEDDVIDLGVDRLLERHVREHARELSHASPFFLVVHLAGTHAPYFVDEGHAPFRPYSNVVRWSGMVELENAYKNALVEQDERVAGVVEAFLGAQGDRPWVIVFTSDHGEAFGEHHAIHHGQNLFDEQIRVPFFVAHGEGALTLKEASALRARANESVTHLDLVPTILDAFGVWDAPSLTHWRRAMFGRTLIGPNDAGTLRPIPVSNCTRLFPCPIPTWGILDGDWKLVAQAWDADFTCLETLGGTFSERSAGPEDVRCRAMRDAARLHFPALPNGRSIR